MSLSENLYNLGALLKTNLETKGINGLTGNEGLTTLANKILDIEGSSSSSKSVFAYVTGNSITLGYNGRWLNSTGDVVIDWGDGTSDTVNNPSTPLSHTYANANGHLIAFNGDIKILGDRCFYQCSGLTSVIILNSVVSIGNNCFRDCSSLTSIIIPNRIVSLGAFCFKDCSSLTNMVIPDSVTHLAPSCFYNCSGLTSIIIPNSVTYLGTDCFCNCTSLVDYELYWETQPIQYDSQKMPVNTDTVFTIPYGTTSIYVDAGYPLDKLVERIGTPTDLTLTSDKSIIQKTETATITALLEDNGLPVYNQNLSYSIKCDSIVLDSGSVTTDLNGEASINYVGTGVGDVSVEITYGTLLQEAYVIEDCFKYDTTVHTRTTTHTSDTLTPIYDDFSFLSDNFCAEFVWQGSGEGVCVGIAPKGRTTPYHHFLNGCGTLRLSTYLGDESGNEIIGRWGSFQNNTDYRFKIEYMNGTVKYYINDELKIVYSDKTYLNGETRDLYFSEWNENLNIQVKDIKIKTLNSINLTSTSNIVSYNDSESTTITATVNHPFNNNQSITFTAIDKNENIIDTYTTTTDNNGTATYEYESRGIGDVTIEAKCMSLQETYEVEDCFKYDTTVHTRATDSTTDTLIPVYNDYSLVSDRFSLEFTFQASDQVGGVGIAPKGRTTPYHHILIGLGANKLSAYIGNQNGGETPYRYGSAQYNTDYNCKIEYDDGTVKFYVNNVLMDTITGKSYLNGETRDLYFLEWAVNETIKVKDIKVKALDVKPNNLVLSSTTPIIQKNDTAIINASLTNNDVPVGGKTLNYVVEHNGSVLDSGSVVTGSDGKVSVPYTGTGVGDVDIVVSYGTLLQETYEIQDCFYWNDGSSVTGLEIDSDVSCTSNGDYITITTSTSGEKYVYLTNQLTSSDEWVFETEVAETGVDSSLNLCLNDATWFGAISDSQNNIYVYFGGVQSIPMPSTIKGGVYKVIRQNGTTTAYWNDTVIGSTTNNPKTTFKLGYFTKEGRVQYIKNLKLKAL